MLLPLIDLSCLLFVKLETYLHLLYCEIWLVLLNISQNNLTNPLDTTTNQPSSIIKATKVSLKRLDL